MANQIKELSYDIKTRNNEVRNLVEKLKVDYGVSYKFIASKSGIASLSSFSQWKAGKFNYTRQKLLVIEELIYSYLND